MKFFPTNINLNILSKKGPQLLKSNKGVIKCPFDNILNLIVNGHVKLTPLSSNKDNNKGSSEGSLLILTLLVIRLVDANKLSSLKLNMKNNKGNKLEMSLMEIFKQNKSIDMILNGFNKLIQHSPRARQLVEKLSNLLKKQDPKFQKRLNNLIERDLMNIKYSNKKSIKDINLSDLAKVNLEPRLLKKENNNIHFKLLQNIEFESLQNIKHILNDIDQYIREHYSTKELKNIKKLIDKLINEFNQNKDIISTDLEKAKIDIKNGIKDNGCEKINKENKKFFNNMIDLKNYSEQHNIKVYRIMDKNFVNTNKSLNKVMDKNIGNKFSNKNTSDSNNTPHDKDTVIKKQDINIKYFEDNILNNMLNNKVQDFNLEMPRLKFRDQVLEQIQNGILRNLGEGKREISLRLRPPELGAMKIILQVQGKDVSVVIRTENHEVANTLNQHIANFEKSLEHQGLKLVRIEVRNDLGGGHENSWAGFHGFKGDPNNQGSKRRGRSFFKLDMIGERDIEGLEARGVGRNNFLTKNGLYVVA